MSISQSIRSFADDAKASLAALDAALGSTAAVALLRRGGALDWADAVIPSADLAVERAMLDAPAAVAGAEGPTRGHADARDETRPPAGLLPAPGDASGSRGEKGAGRRASKAAARDESVAPATTRTTTRKKTNATTSRSSRADAALPAATAASLERAGALAKAEAASALRCLRERDAVKTEGLASRKRRRRYKTGDDVYRVSADARADEDPRRSTARESAPQSGDTRVETEKQRKRLVPGVDVLVSVGIHNPAKPAMVLEEFLCAGSDSLAALKDRVTCAADEQAVEAGLPARERRGFFFVEGVFHEDTRDALEDAGGDGAESGEGTRRRRDGDGATTRASEDDAAVGEPPPETYSASYAAPIEAYHASVIRELGAGAHRQFAAPG